MKESKKGKVYLVGAGPGDVELVTLKALQAIKKADVIVYDALANTEILLLADENVEKIYVGKSTDKHTLAQSQINQLLLHKAKEGKIVVRLKGGDPFIFGRGGEEAEFLAKNEIEFEVIPGISSAIAVPAYAGIPLTHRKYTSTITILTGHEDIEKSKSSICWEAIAKIGGTIVILMGVANLPHIVKELIKNGINPKTPIAVIKSGTLNIQKTIIGTLEDIINKTKGITPPAISVIGEVVNLRKSINWFEKKPLLGKRILVTRAREQASELSKLLRGYGAVVVEFPVIKIVPPLNFKELDKAISQLDTYNWIVFTSTNGVKYFFDRLREKGKDVRELKGIQIAAIGPETKKMLEKLELNVDCQPEKEFTQEGLIECFEKWEMEGKRILVPRSEQARKVLIKGLKEMDTQVDEVTAYRTVREDTDVAYLKELFAQSEIDIITFTSSSTVTNFCSIFNDEELGSLLNKVKIASIGPITTKKAQALGLKVDITAKEYTIRGLVKEIIKKKLDNVKKFCYNKKW